MYTYLQALIPEWVSEGGKGGMCPLDITNNVYIFTGCYPSMGVWRGEGGTCPLGSMFVKFRSFMASRLFAICAK